MPIVTCPKCHKRYDPGVDEAMDDIANAPVEMSMKVVCPACGQWLRLPEKDMIPAPAFPPDLIKEMRAQSRLVDDSTASAPLTAKANGNHGEEVIPAAMGKVVFCWAFSIPIILVGVLFLVFRWSVLGLPWYVNGPAAILTGIVVIWVWDGLLPLRKRRLVIGADSFRVVEFGNQIVSSIPFNNIEDVRVEDHYDKESGARMRNYYVIITLRNGQDDQTKGTFSSDEASGTRYLQLQDSYASSTRKICELLQSRIQAFRQRRGV